MPNTQSDEFTCSNCGKEIGEDDDFCPHCGAIFAEKVFCEKHERVEASGVCIICGTPCCGECGTPVNDLFLCNRHCNYEIFEGMVKVFGTYDVAEAEIARSRLEEADLHPALFHLHTIVGRRLIEYEPFDDGQQFNTRELKLMVPCQEVTDAENILKTP